MNKNWSSIAVIVIVALLAVGVVANILGGGWGWGMMGPGMMGWGFGPFGTIGGFFMSLIPIALLALLMLGVVWLAQRAVPPASKTCPSCGLDAPPGARFCWNCGKPLK